MAKNYLTPFLTEDIHGTEIIQALNLANVWPIQEFNQKKLRFATDKSGQCLLHVMTFVTGNLVIYSARQKSRMLVVKVACHNWCFKLLTLFFRLMWEYDPWWLPVGHQFV